MRRSFLTFDRFLKSKQGLDWFLFVLPAKDQEYDEIINSKDPETDVEWSEEK